MKKKRAARRMLPPVYRSGGASVNAVDDGDVARLDGGGSDGEAAAARAAARMERLGSTRQRGGGTARDGARRRDRGARLARRCGRGGEPVVAPRPLRRGRARPRHRRGDAAARLARRAPLADAETEVRRRLGVADHDPLNQRHNAFLAAATLRRYLDEMHGDPFLGLLAYNIGPRNGGLRAIMEPYGARDFATIQPYLSTLPRDYPIRGLSAALPYRLRRPEGRLPRSQDDAQHIQSVGVPGLTVARG